ncbi:MAG: hypothetical protein AAGM22_08910 [Acidobacteriota bacterium]
MFLRSIVKKTCSSTLILAAFLVTGSQAAADTVTLEIERLDANTAPWSALGIPATSHQLTIVDGPAHGSLSVNAAARTIEFQPDLEFWTLEHDRFEVEHSGLSAPESITALVVAIDEAPVKVSGFEIGDLEPVDGGDPIDISAAGALLGARGIYRDLASGQPPGFGIFGWQELGFDSPNTDPTGNAASGEIHITIDTPPDDPPGQNPGPVPNFWTLFSTFGAASPVAASVRVGHDASTGANLLRARFTGNGVDLKTDPWAAPLAPGLHRVRFELRNGGLRLWIDDRATTELSDPSIFKSTAGLSFGYLDGIVDRPHTLKIDQLVTYTGSERAVWQLGLADDFEVDFSQWAQLSEGAGTVELTRSAQRLRLHLDGTLGWGSYVRDSELAAAGDVSVRFRFDTSSLTMGAGEQLFLLVGYPGDPVANNHLQLRLRPDGQDFEVRLDAKDDLGAVHATPWHSTPRGDHLLEIRWRAATETGVADGYVRLFVDGAFAGEALGIENPAAVIEALRLGALGVDDGTFGTLEIDDYVSWQRSPSE